MEILTGDGTINIEAFSAENMKELLEGYGGAGDDDEFVQALATSYQGYYMAFNLLNSKKGIPESFYY